MTVRVRFAPSPTGYLHIGGARTALYNYLYAKATGGTFILRVEDTDEARSTKEFEKSQIADLKWLGMEFDEGPEIGGEHGPYRQSERYDLYKKYAYKLLDDGFAYYCFCTDEELEAKKDQAKANNEAPHYDGTCRHLSKEDALKRIEGGETATIRFKAFTKSYTLKDHVRGDVTFPEAMVGDFVILRSSGLPVFNYCNVIDDWLMKITHVIRGEDHLQNTLRQLMIYEALQVFPPEYAHVSLMVGKDRQKLSKRHGATSVTHYRENFYLPQAMVNYLCQLGWSHPEEKDIFNMEEASKHFSIDRFSKSPAVFDLDKFSWINAQHLRSYEGAKLVDEVENCIPDGHAYHGMTREWKISFLELYKEKVSFYSEFITCLEDVFALPNREDADLKDILSWETTPQIQEYLREEVEKLIATGKEFPEGHDFSSWGDHIKKELKIKGKPLFMGMRGVLTGRAHGPELKVLIPLTPLSILKKRIG